MGESPARGQAAAQSAAGPRTPKTSSAPLKHGLAPGGNRAPNVFVMPRLQKKRRQLVPRPQRLATLPPPAGMRPLGLGKTDFSVFACLTGEKIENPIFVSLFQNLSRREREVMAIVFSLEEATLTQIAERMQNPPTRAALRSVLTILERKGHLLHDPERRGREFVFRPVPPREPEGRLAWRQVVRTFFGGSVRDALAAWLADPEEEFTKAELRELENLIRAARQRSDHQDKS